jgi:uncharacterized membrane protein YozB (DUF420 family)
MPDLLHAGFLGTAAPRYADLALLSETVLGVQLLIGALLARRKHFRLHAWCQNLAVLLNAGIIVILMVPSFHLHVSPKIPAKLNKTYYSLATAHAVCGGIAEIGGLYLVIAAGTRLLPPRFRLTRYKLWMRSVLLLWWLAILLGWMTYIRWYLPLQH